MRPEPARKPEPMTERWRVRSSSSRSPRYIALRHLRRSSFIIDCSMVSFGCRKRPARLALPNRVLVESRGQNIEDPEQGSPPMPTSPRTIRPLVPVTTCKPTRIRTQPKAETKAPTSFMPPAPAFCAGFPSSGLSFRNVSRLITTMSAPANCHELAHTRGEIRDPSTQRRQSHNECGEGTSLPSRCCHENCLLDPKRVTRLTAIPNEFLSAVA